MESLSRYYYILSPFWTIYNTIDEQIRDAILLKFFMPRISDMCPVYMYIFFCFFKKKICFLYYTARKVLFRILSYIIDRLKCALGAYI